MFIAASDGGSIRRTTPTYSFMLFSSLRKLAIPISCFEYCKAQLVILHYHQSSKSYSCNSKNAMKIFLAWYFCYEGLKALAKGKRDGFPELKLIIWWTQMSIAWFGRSERSPIPPIGTLIRTFEEVDVLFSWIQHPAFEGSPFGQAFRPLPVGNYMKA
jgi:hypothetical protein